MKLSTKLVRYSIFRLLILVNGDQKFNEQKRQRMLNSKQDMLWVGINLEKQENSKHDLRLYI